MTDDIETALEIFSQLWAKYSHLPPLAGVCAISGPAIRDGAFFAKVAAGSFGGRAPGTAIMYAVPYLTAPDAVERRNIARFAVFPDYHRFMAQLGAGFCGALRARFPGSRFAAFCDRSPLCEADCAAAAGLGMRGRNNLLITGRYGTFVFIGEVICDLQSVDVQNNAAGLHPACEACGMCVAACPTGALDAGRLNAGACLSALTQAKRVTPEQRERIARGGSVWGCDICQDCCPCNDPGKLTYTDIECFLSERVAWLGPETLAAMDDAEFAARAYAWRGRDVVARNAEIVHNV